MSNKKLWFSAVAAACFGLLGNANASVCGSGSGATTLDTTNVMFGLNLTPQAATGCVGPISTSSLTDGSQTATANYFNTNPVALAAFKGTGWTDIMCDQATGQSSDPTTNSTLYNGIQFKLDALQSATNGNGSFALTLTDTNGTAPINLPSLFDFVIVLKASEVLGGYYFDDVVGYAGANTGSYQVKFAVNDSGKYNNLSHMDILVRAGGSEGGAPASSVVPEPESLALFGLGLLGFAVSRRNRVKN